MIEIKYFLELLREKCSECEGNGGAHGEESGMWYRCQALRWNWISTVRAGHRGRQS